MSNEPTLIGIAQRIVRLNSEKNETEEMIKEVYAEARSVGYDPKVLKRAIRFMELDEKNRKKQLAEQEMFDLYVQQMDLPL